MKGLETKLIRNVLGDIKMESVLGGKREENISVY